MEPLHIGLILFAIIALVSAWGWRESERRARFYRNALDEERRQFTTERDGQMQLFNETLEKKAELQSQLLNSLTKAGNDKPQYWVRPWKPLRPDEWAAIFREWPESDSRWRALWDMLAHHLEAELAGAEALDADPQKVVQWSGRLQTLLFLRAQLLNLRNQP